MFGLTSILCNNDFPVLAHNIGIACLTILIPVAVALFTTEEELKVLDNRVVLDHVTEAKWLLVYIGLLFLPFLFWLNASAFLRTLELLVWITGIYFLIRIFGRTYRWVKGNKFPERFAYLRQLSDPTDMEEAWSAVWQSDINGENEIKFFEIFSGKLDKFFKQDG